MTPLSRARRSLHTIGGRLTALVLLMLLPITCVSLVAAFSVYSDERRAVVAAAQETAKALSLVADRELAVRAAVLTTLASSASLDRGDLEAFYREAKAVVPTIQNTIVLLDLDGRQVLNTRAPFDAASLPRGSARFADGLRESPGMTVSDLYMSPLGKAYSFSVRVPVVRDGQVRWHLGMGSFASQLQRIFEQQPLPDGWVGSLLDSSGYLIARNSRPELVGRRATDDMLERLQQASAGVHETRSLDGVPVLTVFSRAPESGWRVLIGLPRDQLQRPAWNAFGRVMAASLLITVLALWLARRIARSMVDPVRRLQADAQALGRGALVAQAPSGLAEIDAVQRLLAEASRERTDADMRLRAKVAEAISDTERAQRAAMSAQKLEALGRLTGGIAHDFNNLLQTMTTGLKLADRLATDPRASQAIAACERAVDKAVKLTRQLMTFGRAQAGRMESIEPWRQFAQLEELLRGAVPTSIDLVVDVPRDLWQVHVDPVQLELAVLNLVVNARDAIDGAGTIRVSGQNRTVAAGEIENLPAGDFVALWVCDDGSGIAPEALPRIFEPFFTTKPLTKGSGLGLAQVYGFARQSGGTATVSSEPGKGTRVTMWIPRTESRAHPDAPSQQPRPPVEYRGTVLVVEDDSLVRGLVSEGLEELGFSIVVASTADDALAIARARPDIDVVLSDVVMPGGRSGLDLVRTLAVLRPALPVLLATGYAEALDGETDVTVIAKPYKLEEVAAKLAQAIRAVPHKGS
jgi:signal transduction histidine kinase/CheY-like chemotaxis protein